MARDTEARRASQRVASRKWYAGNQEKQIAANAKRRQNILEWWRAFKLTLCCEQCGESHPDCLDFHHNDPAQKEMCLYQISSSGWGQKRILNEVAKCRVLCANCHRKLHSKMRAEGVDIGEEPG